MTNPKECVTKCLVSSEKTGDRRLVSDIVKFVNAMVVRARLRREYKKAESDVRELSIRLNDAHVKVCKMCEVIGIAESAALITIMKKTGVL